MRRKSGREITGWKHPPSAWFPQIGYDYEIRGGQTLKDYVAGEMKEQEKGSMKRKTGAIKKKKVRGKWVPIA